jgi:hypothetical protein
VGGDGPQAEAEQVGPAVRRDDDGELGHEEVHRRGACGDRRVFTTEGTEKAREILSDRDFSTVFLRALRALCGEI